MNNKTKVAIIGPGNIGLDLLHKIERSDTLELVYMVGVKDSIGIDLSNKKGIMTTKKGIVEFLEDTNGAEVVFDCTSAAAHLYHAPMLKEKGLFAIDLTPAAIGPYLVPAVNMSEQILNTNNVNLVTCAGQATVPIVAAINDVAEVLYAEVISSISSSSAGPGTRANIDEFTVTTKKALINIGGADEAKVIIILNPAEPPINMRNTIYTKVKNVDFENICQSVINMANVIKQYVPGYEIVLGPLIQGDILTTVVQVEGLGDYLPKYSGNLDIITSAAVNIAEEYSHVRRNCK